MGVLQYYDEGGTTATPEDVNNAAADREEPETSAVQLTTTEEAKQEARRAINDYYGHVRVGEDAIAAEATRNANAAKAALRAAQQRLMQDPYAPTPQELAYRQGAALMDPGRTGRPQEGLRSYYGELAAEAQQERERQAALAQSGLGYETQIQGINDKLMGLRQKLLEGQEKNAAQLAKQGIQTLGRVSTSAAGTKPLSKEGKQALDEGLTMGSPEWNARVHELVQAEIADAHARAGTDTQELSPQEVAQIADENGIPAHVVPPWNGMSTKERINQKRIEAQKAMTDFAKYPDQDRQIADMNAQIDRFLNINARTHTGPELGGLNLPGLSAGPHGASVHGGEGWNLNPVLLFKKFDPNIVDMDKITQNLITTMQKPGFSRVTNFDLQTFGRGMMGIDKAFQTNKDIAVPLKVFSKDAADFHQFVQNYYQVHGTRQGAEQAWDDYLNHMPIFDPKAPVGSYRLNPNRMGWQDYFRAKNRGIEFPDVLGDQFKVGAKAPHESQKTGIIQRPNPVAGMVPPGQIPGTDQGAPPPRAPMYQAADEQPAIEQHAEGGEVGEDQDPSELESALQALRSGMTYKASQGKENPHAPVTNFLGETAGGAGTAAALLSLAKLRGRLGQLPARAARFAAENPKLAATGAGAIGGGLAGGFGSPQGETAEDMLTYGANGALLGFGAGLAGRGAAGRLQALQDRIRGRSPISAGDKRTISAIERDMRKANGANWDDLSDIMRDDRKLKVPSTLGESVGPSTTGLTKAALSKDTPAGRDYAEQLDARQTQAGSRVGEKVNQALAPDPYLQQQDKLRESLYKNSSPLYEQAYKAYPAVRSQALLDILNTPAGNEAASRAVIKMRNKQRPIGAVNPVTGMVEKPSLEYLDNVKRSLDDMIIREEGTGANYQATDDGSILRGMREKLRNELDQATALPNGQPGPYQQARSQYAGDLEVMDALRSGFEDFRKLTPDALKQAVANMSFAERDAFRSGVAEYFFRQLGSATEGVNPAKRLISNPDIADKIGAIFENPRDATKFISGLQRESEMYDASRPVLTAANKGQEQGVTPSSLASLARAKLMTEQTANDISSNMSTSALDPRADEKINRLRDAADRLRSRDTLSRQAGAALAAGVGSAAVPSGANQQPPLDQEQQ